MSEFPRWLKYSNEKHYFKIESEKQFEEIYKMGGLWKKHTVAVRTFADRNFLEHLLKVDGAGVIETTEAEYEEKNKLVS